MPAPRVLVVADYFLPGFRAGGPIRALANTMTRLSPGLAFAVVTRDHDTDGVRYSSVSSERWNTSGCGAVFYASRLTRATLERCIQESSADVVWLNSFFSRASLRVLLARRMGRIRQPVAVAPRGELSAGALSLKRWRKAIGVWGLLNFGFLRGLHWIASSDQEARDIRDVVGGSTVTIVPESIAVPGAHPPERPAKQPGRLRAVCASRIIAMKNQHFLLDTLAGCAGSIHLDLIGPIDDPSYWARCERLIARLPSNVTVSYLGEMVHAELMRCLPSYDLMVLPTLGENFGHVVVEAWAAGCPVLVSDRTPWRHLTSEGVGWDLPLEKTTWVEALQRGVSLTAAQHEQLRRSAVERAGRVWQDGVAGDDALKQLFARFAGSGGAARGDASLTREEVHTTRPELCG